jgi:hypothetical protein
VSHSRYRAVVAALAVAVTAALGSDSIPAIATRVAPDAAGKLSLEVSGALPDSAHWLGVSFYLPGYTDAVWDADHSVYAVKGVLRVSLPIPAGFEKGTYEVGLWKSKLAENTFYRAEWLRAYGSGSMKTGPDSLKLADSLSALKTEPKGGKPVLVVSGKSLDQRWLGVSFYKPGYADAITDGSYSMVSIAKGAFSQSVAVPPGFEDGTYEAALWARLVAKKKVFKLDGLLGYGGGAVGKREE